MLRDLQVDSFGYSVISTALTNMQPLNQTCIDSDKNRYSMQEIVRAYAAYLRVFEDLILFWLL